MAVAGLARVEETPPADGPECCVVIFSVLCRGPDEFPRFRNWREVRMFMELFAASRFFREFCRLLRA